jgi:hypothetical protein
MLIHPHLPHQWLHLPGIEGITVSYKGTKSFQFQQRGIKHSVLFTSLMSLITFPVFERICWLESSSRQEMKQFPQKLGSVKSLIEIACTRNFIKSLGIASSEKTFT